MIEAKHTPGPWKVVFRNVEELQYTNIGVCIGDHIIELGDFSYRNNKADANIIAAAPELLEALEELMNDAEEAKDYGYVSRKVFEKAEQAIAKAKGENNG